MISDPISDMLARINNAVQRKHPSVIIPLSKIKLNIAKVLKQEGYIENYEFSEKGNKGEITITLKYKDGQSPFHRIRRISKPGIRRYSQKKELPLVMQGMGIAIVSTSKGVMASHHARKQGLGGEIICKIW